MKLGCTKWGLILAVYALSGCYGMGAAMVESIATGVLMGGGIPSYSMPVDYRSQAEKEIKSGTYDPGLWAEALVLVDGDEEKRYAKYIELRAEQLYSEARALKWLELDAKRGNAKAQHNLGVMYLEGQGVTQDYKIALHLFQLAAEQGDAEAHWSLGFMYQNGFGVTQDPVRAYMWWDIAASKGNADAAGGLTELQGDYSPAQLEKAQELARECVAKNYKDC